MSTKRYIDLIVQTSLACRKRRGLVRSTKRYIDLVVEAAFVSRQRRGLARGIYFPPELVDHICSYLCEDLSSLRQCSLVCRSWAGTSSRYLFRKAVITLCPVEPSFTRSGLHVILVEDMLHRLSTIARISSIRDLRLLCTCTLPQHISYNGLRYTPPIYAASLRDFLASLPHLKTLEISHHYIQSAPSPLSSLDGPRRMVKVVFIGREKTVFNPEAYVDILQLFEVISVVEFLHLPDPAWITPSVESPGHISPPTLPQIQSLQFSQSSSQAVATTMKTISSRVDMLSIRNLSIQNVCFRPEEMLQAAFPQFLSRCTSLETLNCDPHLLRFTRHATLQNLRKIEIYGKLHLEKTQMGVFFAPVLGEPPQPTSQNVLRSGWLEIFYAIPLLDLPSLESIYICFDLFIPKLNQVNRRRYPSGTSEIDLLNTLNSPATNFWPFLDRLIGKAKSISLHMELHLPICDCNVLDTPDMKEQYMQIIQGIAEARMSLLAKQTIQFFVS
ncbi:hypothetical protein PHLGIDRAFT_232010 [Phlebiopsis gigantea 11061_1 CR5-6]|uniref:F-box domain-containing protein n=1 Tax=Phlebiopsis gigantea (strain 11061_1 CR5-6) TaxID=745531 RepID=A0A0C3S472_PHLG1|nr:hypothetical protein PHLGIDRAFT_232010 [Phlebiopsis gigantea 11061_1 CR5-6]